jgi:hypothetical protein
MSEPSHQTIQLSRGRHASPDAGACVMELASMLAGEPFSDHPRSVCPVIATVLRAYNDSVDDARRQDLYYFASAVVGSRGDRACVDARLSRCEDFLGLAHPRRWPFTRRRRRLAAIGRAALERASASGDAGHRETLRFVGLLLDTGGERDLMNRVNASISASSHEPR